MDQIKKLSSTDSGFAEALERIISFEGEQNAAIDSTVSEILADVKKRGDVALLEYTCHFDGLNTTSVSKLELPKKRIIKGLYKAYPPNKEKPLNKPQNESEISMRNNLPSHGAILNLMVRYLARR